MRLKAWGIKTKLIAVCTLIVLLGAGIGVWNLSNFRWAGTMFQVASQENLPALDYLTEADRDMQQALVAERSLIFVRQASEEGAKMRKAHEENLQQVENRWQKISGDPHQPRGTFALARIRARLSRVGEGFQGGSILVGARFANRAQGCHRYLAQRRRSQV